MDPVELPTWETPILVPLTAAADAQGKPFQVTQENTIPTFATQVGTGS